MLSFVSAILLLMFQGSLNSDVAAHGDGRSTPSVQVRADAQRLLASLQRISRDPALSRMIAELFAPEGEFAVTTATPTSEAEEDSASVSITPAPAPLGVAREGVARSVRLRAGPVLR